MRKYILRRGETVDEAYQRIAGEIGLHGAAFFGHKVNKNENRKLNYVWKQLLKQNGKE